jgi:hypothetical protein
MKSLEFDKNQTLCFRVAGYYRSTVPGGPTVIHSGFLTLVDAQKLRFLMGRSGFIKEPRLQIKLQGEEWQEFQV